MIRTLRSTGIWIAILALLMTAGAANAQSVTPRQKQQLKDMALAARQKTEREREDLRKARGDLLAAYQRYDLDERKVRSALQRISKDQLDLLNAHLENQLDIRQVLDRDQFGLFWSVLSRGHGPEMIPMPPPEDMLIDRLPDRPMLDQLGLSAEQRRRAESFVGPTPQKTKVIEKLKRDSRQMIEVYSNYNLDTAAAKKLIQSIHDSQDELAELSYKKQQAIRAVLSESQFLRLQSAMTERLRNLQQQRHNGDRRQR